MAKRGRSFYLTDEAYGVIDRFSREWGLSNNAVIERVLREADQAEIEGRHPDRDELLEEMRDQVGFLRRELERRDTIIMALTQRVPELEPVRETHQDGLRASNTAQEDESAETAESRETGAQRPWWRRLMGD